MFTISQVIGQYLKLRRKLPRRQRPQTVDEQYAAMGEPIDWAAFGMPPSPVPPAGGRPPVASPAEPSVLDLEADGKRFLDHLKSYLNDQSQASFLQFHRAMCICWKHVREGTFTTDLSVKACEENFLKWLTMNVAPLEQWPKKNGEMPKELAPFLPEFESIMSFGCLDIWRFAGEADPNFLPAALNRCWASEVIEGVIPPMDLNLNLVRFLAGRVKRNKAAECFGFAVAAFACLINPLCKATNIRMKVSDIHNYVTYHQSGSPGVIIDLWLGSVGKPWCWLEDDKDYPFRKTPITVFEFESA